MTSLRLAALAALSLVALLATASIGEAQREVYRANTTCKTAQSGPDDFAKFKTVVDQFQRGGPGRPPGKGPPRRGSAAAFVRVDDAKVVVTLKDKTPQNGNDIVDGKDSDKTNDNGVAKNTVEFGDFGNYRAIIKTKVNGDVVDKDTIDFGVADRQSGKCDPTVSGPPQ
jgi:hypothetical protein